MEKRRGAGYQESHRTFGRIRSGGKGAAARTALAKGITFETVLLRAYNLRPVISTFEDYVPYWDLLEAEAMGEAMSYLNGKARELKGQGLIEVSTRASEKEPAQEIIDLASCSFHYERLLVHVCYIVCESCGEFCTCDDRRFRWNLTAQRAAVHWRPDFWCRCCYVVRALVAWSDEKK